jgi:hypothetical protein
MKTANGDAAASTIRSKRGCFLKAKIATHGDKITRMQTKTANVAIMGGRIQIRLAGRNVC